MEVGRRMVPDENERAKQSRIIYTHGANGASRKESRITQSIESLCHVDCVREGVRTILPGNRSGKSAWSYSHLIRDGCLLKWHLSISSPSTGYSDENTGNTTFGTYSVFKQEAVLRILSNAVRWLA